MRILFAGSPEIALPALRRAAAEHELVGVLTNPDAQKGRGLSAARTPVAQVAEELGLPVLSPERLGPEARESAAALGAELLVSFAYGRIFGPKFLALFLRGGLNVHPSLLPRWRGCAPIPAAILHRDAETGVAVQRLALAMDEGELLGVERIPLSGRETTESLSALAAEIGAGLLSRVLREIAEGREAARPQEGEASYCSMLRKEDGLLDFGAPALDLDAKARAFHPWPGAYAFLRGQRLAVLETEAYPGEAWAGPVPAGAAGPGGAPRPGAILGLDKTRGIMVQTGEGLLALRRLQLQHKKALPFREFANGIRDLAGAELGTKAEEEAGSRP